MMYCCKRCASKEGFGFLPTFSCGMLLVVHGGIASAAASFLSILLVRSQDSAWWWAAWPLFFVVGFLLSVCLFELIEFLLIHLFKCPSCGARRWSWGFTEGFGL
ncbi:MAG: hypothetical protein H6840_09925 [Planctomycetes bacterium]|nr:hypothetical protein [Planctomycetota bacterium]